MLPGDQIDSINPRRWLLVKPEMGVPCEANGYDRWAVDHLFLDQDGIPTFVEVKRSTDTRIRREVVGQILDYAANAIVYWPIDRIRSQFESNLKPEDSEQKLKELLGDDADTSNYWEQVNSNLLAGKIRLIFVADKIPPELQRIVEFLHQQMNPAKVFAIEIKQYMEQGNKILASRVIGQTIDVKNPEYSKKIKNQWDESRLFDKIKSQGEEGYDQVLVAQKICEWVNKHGIFEIEWSQGNTGGFYLTLNHQNIKFKPASLWAEKSSKEPYAVIQFEFGELKSKPVFQEKNKRLDWLNKLNQISGISISNDKIEGYPKQSLSIFKEEAILQQLFQTLDWVAEEIKAS
ncbi:MAG TPA: hypothetical protein V6D28_00745 [Leptolyngbyaceae cyanobacterium]